MTGKVTDTDRPIGPDELAAAYGGKRVAVTGATGFVGARLTRELVALGAEVTALSHDDGTGEWRLGDAAGAIRSVETDLGDPVSARAALAAADPETVFHLATYYAVDNDVDLAEMIDTNVKAAAVVVAASAGLPSLEVLVNTGTCAEYGDFRGQADEDTRVDPNNVYASTKAAQTVIAMQLGRDLEVPVTTLRLYNMYGEYEKPSRLVPHVALSLHRGREVRLTAGEQAKDYSYVGDVVRAFLAAGARPAAAAGEVFNIGSGSTVTMRELVEEIARHFPGSEELVRFGALPYRADEMWFQGTSAEKARRLLGWSASTPLSEGIASVVAWYRENADAWYADA